MATYSILVITDIYGGDIAFNFSTSVSRNR